MFLGRGIVGSSFLGLHHLKLEEAGGKLFPVARCIAFYLFAFDVCQKLDVILVYTCFALDSHPVKLLGCCL
jgi:hypothetical protein